RAAAPPALGAAPSRRRRGRRGVASRAARRRALAGAVDVDRPGPARRGRRDHAAAAASARRLRCARQLPAAGGARPGRRRDGRLRRHAARDLVNLTLLVAPLSLLVPLLAPARDARPPAREAWVLGAVLVPLVGFLPFFHP